MEITEKNLKNILKDQEKTFEKHNDELVVELKRHNEVLYEKFRGDIKIIGEGWGAIKDEVEQLTENQEIMTVKLDAVMDVVSESRKDIAKNTNDISTIKVDVAKNTEDISTIRSDISVIKYDLKEKVDRDEFAALEKRVILLENKIRKT